MHRSSTTSTPSLGLDVGATAIKAVVANPDGTTVSLYRLHRGEPEETIVALVRELAAPPDAIAITGAGGRRIAEMLGLAAAVDPAVALIAAAASYSGVRHIIDIGGGSLSIVDLDEAGRFSGFRTNSLCAAGTGSFLDEQALRMNLSDEARSAETGIANPPRIAARCAVFAKSDLIHRQQEGYAISEMWSGLCRGMVHTALMTLFRGRRPAGPVLLVGGVAKNREVVRWIAAELEETLILPDDPETFSARGALSNARPLPAPVDWQALSVNSPRSSLPRRPPLELTRSSAPSFTCTTTTIDDGTEVRIHRTLSGDVVLGIDIGSTSTKGLILDLGGCVLADLYRRTAGDPIAATQKLMAAVRRAASGPLAIRGVGTTGSGRKMVGAIIGADRIVNEITAHARGAIVADPDVETIFEIGGQDAKFIALREGVPHDSNMNYVCAAGTGSFVEEQAGKLGFTVGEIGDAVMGCAPPLSSDRCTVFMEQDVHALIRAGSDRREVMGSVLYSVVQNYLHKVVGRRPYSRKKICFMGATARNRGLVAAFEQLLGAPISVSPFCHVMGALGVATLVLEEVVRAGIPTTFRGLECADDEVELARETCELCSNHCRITRAIIGAASVKDGPSWGYMCGRDPREKRSRVASHFDAFRKREKLWTQDTRHETRDTRPEARNNANCKTQDTRPETRDPRPTTSGSEKGFALGSRVTSHESRVTNVGIPRALLAFSHLPLWATFFAKLGARVRLSPPTSDDTLASAVDFIGSDYCYPVKLAHGHVRELAGHPEVEFIFLPYIVQGQPHDDGSTRSVFCPYNIAFPSIIKSSGVADEKPILTAVINFQLDRDLIIEELHRELGAALRADRRTIGRAWTAALESQQHFDAGAEAIGHEALERLRHEGGSGIVLLGRPYNVFDPGANLSLPRKIADMGLTALSVDMLPLRNVAIDPLFHNMYWRYGRRILQAATFIAQHPQLHAVFLTNFGCGPDSFLQTYVEQIMRGKPMLMLELDEHSADAGYITRLEAFKDVIDRCHAAAHHRSPAVRRSDGPTVRRSCDTRTTWIPPMHPYGTPLLAAALRSTGQAAKPLPVETAETFELAKRYCRGTECVPLPSTIGAFLNVLRTSDAPERECFFMPSAKGPCRFGQYHTLHRIILDEAGYPGTPLLSWSDETGTYGLSLTASRRCYNAMLAADLLFKARCRIRPYAADRDAFDRLMDEELLRVTGAIERGKGLRAALHVAASRLFATPRTAGATKPLVGIVGEIYVRLNPFCNGRLVETIEDAGGEAWVAPITEWFHYLAFLDTQKARLERHSFGRRLAKNLKNGFMMRQDRILSRAMAAAIGDRLEPPIASTIGAGAEFFPTQFDGESILTIGRALEFVGQGADCIINCAPFGCMPGTLTAGIFQRLETGMGIPVVSLFFDGETDLSHLVRTYLENIRGVPGKKARGSMKDSELSFLGT